jgi:hypothetical protein
LDEQHGNLLSELFDAFAQTKADADVGPPFSLALHWYQNSNIRAGGMEGAIILGLTALDLLGAMVVVDRAGMMSDSKYDKLVAKDKLARLFDVLKVPNAIPPSSRTSLPSRRRTTGRQRRKRSQRFGTVTCIQTRRGGRSSCPPRTLRRSRRGSSRFGIRSSRCSICSDTTVNTATA